MHVCKLATGLLVFFPDLGVIPLDWETEESEQKEVW